MPGRVSRRWVLVGLYVAAVIPALVLASVQPIWSRVDEAQHADVLAQYQDGIWPVEGRTLLDPRTVAVVQATGVYRWSLPGTAPLPGQRDPREFVPPPPGASDSAFGLWVRRHLWGFSYEAIQPPLYYLLAAPLWIGIDRVWGTFAAVYAVRLFDATLIALLAPLTYLIARRLQPEGKAALVAGAIVAVVPGLVLNTSQVTNDGLAAVLGASVILLALRGADEGWTWRRGLALGILLGASVLTKITAAGLVPLVILALVAPSWMERARSSTHRALQWPAIATAGLAMPVVVIPWLALNASIYGQALPSRAARELIGKMFPPEKPHLDYVLRSAKNAFATFWTGEPYNTMPLTRYLGWASFALTVVVVIGLLSTGWRRLSRRKEPTIVPSSTRRDLVAILGAGLVMDAAWVLATPFISGIGGLMPGRYLYPVAAGILALYAIGLDAAPARLRQATVAAFCAVAVTAMALFVTGHTGNTVQRKALPTGAPGTVLSVSGARGPLTLVVDRLYVPTDGTDAWVHITVSNTGSQAAEWNPMPVHVSTEHPMGGDYASSSPFPERIDADSSYTGWIHLRRDTPGPITAPTLAWVDITTDGYRHVENLSLTL